MEKRKIYKSENDGCRAFILLSTLNGMCREDRRSRSGWAVAWLHLMLVVDYVCEKLHGQTNAAWVTARRQLATIDTMIMMASGFLFHTFTDEHVDNLLSEGH